jgi:hypothetical protein
MRRIPKFLSLIAIAAAAALSAPQAAFSAQFDCNTSTTPRIAVSTAVQTTTQHSNFIDLPGAVVDVTIGTIRCVIVEFSAQARAPAPNAVRVRVTVDNPAVITPNFVDFYTSANKFDGRAATFVLRNVPTGARVFKIQYMSVNGSPVSLEKATMIVRYDPTF